MADECRKGPWTLEEDTLLSQYISTHGEGRWNLLAKRSGLKRTGKSCRLRWLNYLKPDVKRGNLTPEEQFLILELHSKWGNRWSKIAQSLPGRTDNEIKNYWRTRVQKHARHLKIDTDSNQFHDFVKHFWMPRLLQKAKESSSLSSSSSSSSSSSPMILQYQSQSLFPLPLGSASVHTIPLQDCSYKSYSESANMYVPMGLHSMDNTNGDDLSNFTCDDDYFVKNNNNTGCEDMESFNLGTVRAAEDVAESNWVNNDDGFASDVYWSMDELYGTLGISKNN